MLNFKNIFFKKIISWKKLKKKKKNILAMWLCATWPIKKKINNILINK
jgi:hypothetical protein